MSILNVSLVTALSFFCSPFVCCVVNSSMSHSLQFSESENPSCLNLCFVIRSVFVKMPHLLNLWWICGQYWRSLVLSLLSPIKRTARIEKGEWEFEKGKATHSAGTCHIHPVLFVPDPHWGLWHDSNKACFTLTFEFAVWEGLIYFIQSVEFCTY